MRECKACGVQFERDPQALYCTQQCRDRHNSKASYHRRPSYHAARLKQRRENWALTKHWQKSSQCKLAGIPYDCSASDFEIPPLCPVLGVPFFMGHDRPNHPHAPTVDRKDPTLGYVRGNVWVVTRSANSRKGTKPLDQFLAELADA